MMLPRIYQRLGVRLFALVFVGLAIFSLISLWFVRVTSERVIFNHEKVDLSDETQLRIRELQDHVNLLRDQTLRLAASDEMRMALGDPSRPAGLEEKIKETLRFNPQLLRVSVRAPGADGSPGLCYERSEPGAGEPVALAGQALKNALDLDFAGRPDDPGPAARLGDIRRIARPFAEPGLVLSAFASGGRRGEAAAGVLCVTLDFQSVCRLITSSPRHLTYLVGTDGKFLIAPPDLSDAGDPGEMEIGKVFPELKPFFSPLDDNWKNRFKESVRAHTRAQLWPNLSESGTILDYQPGKGEPPSNAERIEWEARFLNDESLELATYPIARLTDRGQALYLMVVDVNSPQVPVLRALERQLADYVRPRSADDRMPRVASEPFVQDSTKTLYFRSLKRETLEELSGTLERDPTVGPWVKCRAPYRIDTVEVRFTKVWLDPDDPNRALGFLMAASEEEILGDFRDEVWERLLWWGIGLVAIGLALAGLIHIAVARPVEKITKAAEALALGQDGIALPTKRRDEIGQLARTFSHTIDQVRDRTGQLAEAAARNQSVLDMAADGILTVDEQGRVESFNRAAERLLGYNAGEVIGRPIEELLLEPADDDHDSDTARPLNNMEFDSVVGQTYELIGRRKDGTTFPVEVALGGARINDRRPLVTAIFRDITEQRRRKDELERAVNDRTAELKQKHDQLLEAKEAAVAAMKTQEVFLSGVAHDLRTPLANVIGYSEELLEQAIDSNQVDFLPDLKLVVKQGQYLQELVDDLLYMNRAINGKGVKLDLKDFDVAEMLSERISGIDYLAVKTRNRVELSLAPDLGTMHSDEVRVWRILMNLLSNACKFTNRGTVTLSAAREPGTTGDEIVFRIADTGIGMGKEELGRLFRRFETGQVDNGVQAGFGLGLSICLLYCKALGGQIVPESEVGKGSTFTVRLPAAVAADSAEPTAPLSRPSDPPLHSARARAGDGSNVVLVIDDDASVRDLVERHLRRDGYQTVSAGTGEEGLRLAKQVLPSVIVLDVVMPGIDGWAVLAALKTDSETAGIPVIMATIVDDRDRGLTLGADEFVTKPFGRDRISSLIRKYTAKGATARLLVVEDDEAARVRLARSLRQAGWDVVEAADGAEALERIGTERPDVILLDLMLPEVDGFELVESIRREHPRRDIPIVVITSASLDAEQRRRLQGQVESILAKGSYKRGDLFHLIRDIVHRSKSELSLQPDGEA